MSKSEPAAAPVDERAPLVCSSRLLPTSRKDLICIFLLLTLSWFLRSLYQNESITTNPLRADAGKYTWAAYNLRFHGSFSKDLPSADPPQTRTDLAPGYPLFLTLFMHSIDQPPGWDFNLRQLRDWQAIMGALVAVLAYALARQGLSLGWSLVVGLLTCLSPHLIAISDYVLTESLFMLVLMSGSLLLTIAWRRPGFWLIFAGAFLIALSAEVRYIALGLTVWMLPLFLFRCQQTGKSGSKTRLIALGATVAAIIAVRAFHAGFVQVAVNNSPELAELSPEHFAVQKRWENLFRSFVPPNFYVRGESHVGVENGKLDWRHPTESSFADAPLAYLRWNSYGRPLVSWHFDNAYNGDVYIYPMQRKGFQDHPLLKAIHRTMRALHWPLYGLTLAGLVILAYQSACGTLPIAARSLWPPALALAYFLAALTFLSWLPRYSIPARPFSYVLAVYCVAWLVQLKKGDSDLQAVSK